MNIYSDKIILVTGAPGKQGGTTARSLVKAGVKLRALAGKPESERANAKRSLGIEVVKGNLNEINSLDLAVEGVYGV